MFDDIPEDKEESWSSPVCNDGNQWCVLLGDNIQAGICGFGCQIWEAVEDFRASFRNDPAGRPDIFPGTIGALNKLSVKGN
jgi:hypothetical protein